MSTRNPTTLAGATRPAQEPRRLVRSGADKLGRAVRALDLTSEDAARSEDRLRVFRARCAGRRWLLLWMLVGPGILAMLGENDGPSMISYAASGATYGIGFFLPFILVTFAMSAVCQEM